MAADFHDGYILAAVQELAWDPDGKIGRPHEVGAILARVIKVIVDDPESYGDLIDAIVDEYVG